MSEQDRVLRRAFELQAEEETEHEEALAAEELRVAVQDVGLDPAYLAKAEEDLQKQAARRRKTRRVLLLAGASLVLAVGLAAGAVRVFSPPAPLPWTNSFDQAGAWSLDVNPGTKTDLRFENEVGRGKVAVVEVERFEARADATFYANLRSVAVPSDVNRYHALALDLKGSLPAARVELEAGPSERWLSAPIPATSEWTTHRLPVADFQHQVYEGGRWLSYDDKPPENITRLSINVGDTVNGASASGRLVLDNLKLE